MKREYDFSAAERGRFYRESAKLRFPASDEEPNWIGPKASSADSSWKKRKEPSVRTVSSHAG